MKTFLQTFIVLSSFRKVLRASLAQSLYTTTQQSHTLKLPSNICFNKMVHTKCRGEFYHHRTDDGTFGKVKLIKIVILTIWLWIILYGYILSLQLLFIVFQIPRFQVTEEQVPWSVPLSSYTPVEFTAPFVLTAVWADPELGAAGFNPLWNKLDGKVNRVSHDGEYKVDKDNRPVNMMGRTGITGRGVLGRWGPNHAADPIVTRWKREENGDIVKDSSTGKNILEFVSIQRKDNGEWAIPGGMVDPGEKVSTTVKREFMEEALDSTGTAKRYLPELKKMVDEFFAGGDEVYKGYVDDPRNTDNAWMETVAFSFHDAEGSTIGKFPLHAGDDAASICWMPLNSKVSLYASHKNMLELVVNKLQAHW